MLSEKKVILWTCFEVWVIEDTLPVESMDTLDIFSTDGCFISTTNVNNENNAHIEIYFWIKMYFYWKLNSFLKQVVFIQDSGEAVRTSAYLGTLWKATWVKLPPEADLDAKTV